jgi:hypothetical protein
MMLLAERFDQGASVVHWIVAIAGPAGADREHSSIAVTN